MEEKKKYVFQRSYREDKIQPCIVKMDVKMDQTKSKGDECYSIGKIKSPNVQLITKRRALYDFLKTL